MVFSQSKRTCASSKSVFYYYYYYYYDVPSGRQILHPSIEVLQKQPPEVFYKKGVLPESLLTLFTTLLKKIL